MCGHVSIAHRSIRTAPIAQASAAIDHRRPSLLRSKEIFIDALDLDCAICANADVVLDHEIREEITVDERDAVGNAPDVLFGRG
jgi:hypothetical protein